MVTIGLVTYILSYNILLKNSRDNIFEIVKKNNNIIDIKLSQIEYNALNLVLDEELYDVFSNDIPDDAGELIRTDKLVTQILNKYFSHYDYIYSIYLVTNEFQFGKSDFIFLNRDNFTKTRLYLDALEEKGKLRWVPTYHVCDMFGINELKNAGIEYPYLFSAVKQLNLVKVETIGDLALSPYAQGAREMRNLPGNVERPVIFINFKEDML